MDTRSVAAIKIDAFTRMVMQNTLSGLFPLYLVTEYQKSGGTWVGQMLSSYLDIPFPRNRLPILKKSVLHGHLMPTPFLKNVLCVFRDGRDTTVSSYFHMLFESDKNSPHLVDRCRDDLQFSDYDDVRSNMPRFIEYLFSEHHKKTLTRRNQFTWSEFVDAWLPRDVVQVKYEDLVSNGVEVMSVVINKLTGDAADLEKLSKIVDEFSFEKQTNRKPGEENTKSFLRKGQPGDWLEKFSRESAEIFHHYAGKQLIDSGYEVDDGWVNSVK